jgi:ABC-type phosphate transport system auxiliary subunit
VIERITTTGLNGKAKAKKADESKKRKMNVKALSLGGDLRTTIAENHAAVMARLDELTENHATVITRLDGLVGRFDRQDVSVAKNANNLKVRLLVSKTSQSN